jgi:alpha-glucosidase (family GH31 glycosyl hydrolase)
VPLDPPRQYVAQGTDEPTTVRVYAGRDGEFRWYEDDGRTLDYQKGQFAWTHLKWDDRARRLTIEPEGDGGFRPGEKSLVVEVIPDGKRQTIRYAGRRVEVGF